MCRFWKTSGRIAITRPSPAIAKDTAKPLFTNMSVEAGRTAEAAWELGLFPDWRELASSGWNIVDLGAGNARADTGEVSSGLWQAIKSSEPALL